MDANLELSCHRDNIIAQVYSDAFAAAVRNGQDTMSDLLARSAVIGFVVMMKELNGPVWGWMDIPTL